MWALLIIFGNICEMEHLPPSYTENSECDIYIHQQVDALTKNLSNKIWQYFDVYIWIRIPFWSILMLIYFHYLNLEGFLIFVNRNKLSELNLIMWGRNTSWGCKTMNQLTKICSLNLFQYFFQAISSHFLCDLFLSLAPVCNFGIFSLPGHSFTHKWVEKNHENHDTLECMFHISGLTCKIKLRLGLTTSYPCCESKTSFSLFCVYSLTTLPWKLFPIKVLLSGSASVKYVLYRLH